MPSDTCRVSPGRLLSWWWSRTAGCSALTVWLFLSVPAFWSSWSPAGNTGGSVGPGGPRVQMVAHTLHGLSHTFVLLVVWGVFPLTPNRAVDMWVP